MRAISHPEGVSANLAIWNGKGWVDSASASIRRHAADIQQGGIATLIRKVSRLLIMLAAGVIVLVVRIIRPIILIRFGSLRSDRIGHFAVETELYLCQRDIDAARRRRVDLFYHSSPVCNQALKRMWGRILHVSGFARSLDRVNRLFPGAAPHVVSMPMDRDFDGFFARTRPHLSFTPEEEGTGQAALRAMGVPEGGSFVCFHARDSAYLEAALPGHDWSYHDYRDSAIRDYLPAAEALVRRGHVAIRMGAIVKERLATANPKIVDYATTRRTEFLDLYLSARCRFFICSANGMYALPMVFRRPIAFVNYVSLEHMPTWSQGDLCIVKKLWVRADHRFLTFQEILASGAGRFVKREQYASAGIELVDNTPEEIAAVAVEMDERLRGTWQTTPEDAELQQRFWSLFAPNDLNRVFRLRIGSEFLRQNRALLEC